MHKEREWDLIGDLIESSAKRIKQLINFPVFPNSELSLIQKSNANVKKVAGYTKSNEVCFLPRNRFWALLETDYSWIISVETVYASSKAHAISRPI